MCSTPRNSYVQVFDGEGNALGFLGNGGACPGCITLGLDIAFDRQGRLQATDPLNRRFVSLSMEMR